MTRAKRQFVNARKREMPKKKDIAEMHRVCYGVWPELLIVKGQQVKVGSECGVMILQDLDMRLELS
jgi:hypothetical protein